MSTLAAARADNFYISKNYDPTKVKPKKSDVAEDKPFKVVEGERVGGSKVRYETPFHVRCQGCQNMVAKGVRFNAIKTWVGNFHSTKIYEFRMKCPQCIQRFVVRTDPQNCEYIYVSGARRIFQANDCTDQSRIRDEEADKKIKENPFSKLENQHKDQMNAKNAEETLTYLKEVQMRGEEDFQINRHLRKMAKVLREEESSYFETKQSKNMFLPLLPEDQKDEIEVDKIVFKTKQKKIKKEHIQMSEREKLKQKMKRMNPNFHKILQKQIKRQNYSNSFIKIKKGE